nr:cellulose synthase-like protein H1 [Ipomoea batatas]
MAVATKNPRFPLYEIQFRNNTISRAIEIVILFLLLSLICYRLFSLRSHDQIPWLLALICEAWFTFVWVLALNAKWNQIQTKTYPQRLLQWLGDGTSEFPAVDMFVTTADPELEPPIITVNTVLSLLALDYPANKLACYVSDDGASPLTFYSLIEASKFAKLWVPFCKKYNVAVRSPFRYFQANPTFSQDSSLDFQHEWKKMKTRVSGVMTNAPFMFNVDCDCYANDPKVALHAMCFFLGVDDKKEAGFVQFPQSFIGGLKDDPYGNQMKIIMEFLGRGISGIQGPFYQGTGCFHRRKVIYGLSPNVAHANADKEQWETFGKSKTFTLSTSQILSGSLYPEIPIFSNTLDAANQVASCGYESSTAWGQKVGWMYGSATEDMLTGITIHSKGWKSAYCAPDPPGFMGSAPTGGPGALTQQKQWATGLTGNTDLQEKPNYFNLIWEAPV